MNNTGNAKVNRKVSVTASEIYELIKRQNFECAITGEKLDVNDATIDHIVPVSIGGGNEISNLQVVTKAANRVKGNLTMEQLVDLCKRIVDKHGNSCGIANDRTSGET
jgi:CRISPR/Cas system Type II protein with McrA/HNH and RuvC-like nuclease domain